MQRARWPAPLAVALVPLLVCAAAQAADANPAAAADDDAALVWDPWEPMNRGIFAFNETLDDWVLEPVAIGWDFVLPDLVQSSVSNFFQHLLMPVRIANDLLQLKPFYAMEDSARFIFNTAFVVGLFDSATVAGIPRHTEDFGQTLGRWGVPPGPYLVLPIFGPSSPRDTVGLAVDSVGAVQSFFITYYILIGAAAVNVVNERSQVIEEVRAERAAAFDFYVAVRGAHTQYRENQVRDRASKPAEADDEDLYYLDEEDEEAIE